MKLKIINEYAVSKSTELYDAFAPYYREYSDKRTGYLKSSDNIIIDFIKCQDELVNNTDLLTMLDIGAGDGIRSFRIAAKTNMHKLILLDNSPQMLKLCTKIPCTDVILGDISNKNTSLEKDSCQFITCIWNVLGHIETPEKRIMALKKIHNTLSSDGFLFLDVNNRYNIKNYGIKNVLVNFLKDILYPPDNNGNVDFKIEINNKKIPAHVHIFSPHEMNQLLKKTGFKIIKKYYLDYSTGKIQKSFLTGQLLYILKK